MGVTTRQLERVAALHEYRLLDGPADDELEAVVRVAAVVAGVPYATLNLIGENRQCQLTTTGFAGGDSTRRDSMCAVGFEAGEFVWVTDASLDPVYRHNPWVSGLLGKVLAGVIPALFERRRQARINGERQELMNAVLETAKNAEYRHPDRACRVRVDVRRDDGGWVVTVTDNGVGIPPGDRARVFEMFTRIDRSGPGGHGVGLSTGQRIVERHGGRIWAEAAEGGGTVVAFPLPGA